MKKKVSFNFLEKVPFFPLGLAIFPALSLYAKNISEVSFSSFVSALAVCLGVCLFLFWGASKITRSFYKGAVISFACEAFLFSYGHIYQSFLSFITDQWMPYVPLNRERFLLISGIVLHGLILTMGLIFLVISSIKIHRSKNIPVLLTAILNISVLFLLSFSLPALSFASVNLMQPAMEPSAAKIGNAVPSNLPKPDIYYIILDGYTRQDQLLTYYGYDNSWFIKGLRELGFYVADKSQSNYSHTELSLPSSLNLEYVHDFVRQDKDAAYNNKILLEMIRNNTLTHFLKANGYRYVHMDSIWAATMSNSSADVEIHYGKSIFSNEYYRILAGTTLLKVFESHISTDLAETHLYNFQKLSEAPAIPGPKFVFAHFLLPHNPYLFTANGKIKERVTGITQWDHLKKMKDWRDSKGYIDQLAFASRKILDTVKIILQTSKTPPIIVVQGDHGWNLILDANSKPGKKLRLSILNAYYLPGNGQEKLYETITPVNSFRLICDNYLGSHFGLLEDKSYFSGPDAPFDFSLDR